MKCKVLDAFERHQRGAGYRGIPFHFTFEQWCRWWEDNLGADWFELSKHTSKLNVVNSFSHRDSSHRQGTHFMMTGHYNPERTTTSGSLMM